MRPRFFVASLCHNGILGGGLFLTQDSLTYRTGKVSVDRRLRELVLPLSEIRQATPVRMLLFPAVVLNMKNGEQWKFIVFSRRHFLKALTEVKPENQ